MSRAGPSGFLINAVALIRDVGVSPATLYYSRDYKALLMVPGLNHAVHVLVCNRNMAPGQTSHDFCFFNNSKKATSSSFLEDLPRSRHPHLLSVDFVESCSRHNTRELCGPKAAGARLPLLIKQSPGTQALPSF